MVTVKGDVVSAVDLTRTIVVRSNKVEEKTALTAEDLAYHIVEAIQNSSIKDKQKYFLDKKILNNYSPQKVSNEIIEIYKSCVA